ncbi:aspartyl/Asparaginyl beta-hydroxylase [Striga asiatica]|uniref:Aspartyl/Asparaginyl beta-hydroxylase n=1 Tax=Striga asiatica TaxID=4170 RepID=A0A5A7QKU4_STRAF|nr:aspartyl/Asparaginyl beta-hydroxylase [Striga asiatica]
MANRVHLYVGYAEDTILIPERNRVIRQPLYIFVNHGGQFVMMNNVMEYFGGEVQSRHAIDLDRYSEKNRKNEDFVSMREEVIFTDDGFYEAGLGTDEEEYFLARKTRFFGAKDMNNNNQDNS